MFKISELKPNALHAARGSGRGGGGQRLLGLRNVGQQAKGSADQRVGVAQGKGCMGDTFVQRDTLGAGHQQAKGHGLRIGT